MMKNYVYLTTLLLVITLLFVGPAAADEHTHSVSDRWTELNNTIIAEQNYSLTSGKYYLQNDCELKKTLIVSRGSVIICLNGHTLTLADDTASIITVNNGASLTIEDCKSTGKIIGLNRANNDHLGEKGGVIHIKSGTLVLENGTICNGTAVRGGGIFVERGCRFEMNDGIIDSCSAKLGGGICNEGTVVINGGTLSNNGVMYNNARYTREYPTDCGGGIYNAGSLTINGGEITLCSAHTGGAIFSINEPGSSLTINGGLIRKCQTDFHNGGDGLYNEGAVSMTGGCIEDNIISSGLPLSMSGSGLILGEITLIKGTKLETSADWTGKKREGYTFDGWYYIINDKPYILTNPGDKAWHFTAKDEIETIQARWTKTASVSAETPLPVETETIQAAPEKTAEPAETENPEPARVPASPLPFAGLLAGCGAVLSICLRK